MGYKTVLYPISVPDGNYCWKYTGTSWEDRPICGNLNNEGGTPYCKFDFGKLEEDSNGVIKPKECADLCECTNAKS